MNNTIVFTDIVFKKDHSSKVNEDLLRSFIEFSKNFEFLNFLEFESSDTTEDLSNSVLQYTFNRTYNFCLRANWSLTASIPVFFEQFDVDNFMPLDSRQKLAGLIIEFDYVEYGSKRYFLGDGQLTLECILSSDGELRTRVIQSFCNTYDYNAENLAYFNIGNTPIDTFTPTGVTNLVMTLAASSQELAEKLADIIDTDLEDKIVSILVDRYYRDGKYFVLDFGADLLLDGGVEGFDNTAETDFLTSLLESSKSLDDAFLELEKRQLETVEDKELDYEDDGRIFFQTQEEIILSQETVEIPKLTG